MWKAVLCALVVLVCLELSVEARSKAGHPSLNKHADQFEDVSDHTLLKSLEQEGEKKDFDEKISNIEQMIMMRLKKTLKPLRELLTKVVEILPIGSIDGKPDFCGEAECPEYTVLNKTDNYELRQYMPTTWVSTSVKVPSWSEEVQSELYLPLTSYMGGANAKGQTFQMTAPAIVAVRPDEYDGMLNLTMSFYMPKSYGSPPAPTNKKLFVQSYKESKAFVHSFKGYGQIWKEQVSILQKLLVADGLEGEFIPREEVSIGALYFDPIGMPSSYNEVWLFAKE